MSTAIIFMQSSNSCGIGDEQYLHVVSLHPKTNQKSHYIGHPVPNFVLFPWIGEGVAWIPYNSVPKTNLDPYPGSSPVDSLIP